MQPPPSVSGAGPRSSTPSWAERAKRRSSLLLGCGIAGCGGLLLLGVALVLAWFFVTTAPERAGRGPDAGGREEPRDAPPAVDDDD